MSLRLPLVIIALLLAVTFTACGPSDEEMVATETAVAADVFATQTAEAPTETPTPTNTATPTETPTPEPTNTPVPTETPEPTDTPAPEPTAIVEPETQVEAALPTVEDLPPGFQELPPEFMDFALGSATSDLVGPSAAFMNMVNNEFVITVLTPVGDDFQQALFEQQLEDPDLLAQMMGLGIEASGAASPELEYELLAETGDVGEKALGIRAYLEVEDFSFVYDIVVFLRSDVGAVTGVMYSQGGEPQMNVIDVAQLVDGRLTQIGGE